MIFFKNTFLNRVDFHRGIKKLWFLVDFQTKQKISKKSIQINFVVLTIVKK